MWMLQRSIQERMTRLLISEETQNSQVYLGWNKFSNINLFYPTMFPFRSFKNVSQHSEIQIKHLNKCNPLKKNLFHSIVSLYFVIYFFFSTFDFLTNLHFNRRLKLAETNKNTEKQTKTVIEKQHLNCGAAFSPEVIRLLSCGLTNRYLFRFFWACLSKVSKSSASNLPFVGCGSYSRFESERDQKVTVASGVFNRNVFKD